MASRRTPDPYRRRCCCEGRAGGPSIDLGRGAPGPLERLEQALPVPQCRDRTRSFAPLFPSPGVAVRGC